MGARDKSVICQLRFKFFNGDFKGLDETIQPEVRVTGHTNAYPMKRTQLLSNRWETLVGPLRPDETNIFYLIKVNWKYNAIPVPRSSSQSAGPFRLRILD